MPEDQNTPPVTPELVTKLIALQHQRVQLAYQNLQELHQARETAAETFGAERATLASLELLLQQLQATRIHVPGHG